MDKKQQIISWGRTVKKNVEFIDTIDDTKIILPVGNLNSYGDSCIPGNVFAYKTREENMVNKTILNFINENQVRLYGVPGKASVTIGGAVASDVHGKDNLWGGPFSKNIEKIYLVVGMNKKIVASREENSELFFSTIGGLGLTGVITGVEFTSNLNKLKNSVNSSVLKGKGLEALYESFKFKESTYWSAWVNLLDNNNPWIAFTSEEKLVTDLDSDIYLDNSFTEKSFTLRLNQKSFLKNVNNLYYFFHKEKSTEKSLAETFYPIKSFLDTRFISGKDGLIQIQFVIPEKNISHAGDLINLIIDKNNPILCSVKRLNDSEGYLSFCKNGWTFAIDFSKKDFNTKNLQKFYKELISIGGKIYLAKDLLLNKEAFDQMYLKINKWKETVKYYDPKNQYQSELSKRLEIKDW